MKTIATPYLLLGTAAVILAGCHLGLGDRVGRGASDSSYMTLVLGPPGWPTDEYDLVLKRLHRHAKEKRQIVAHLLDGTVTLREAAARFRDLDHQQPLFAWDLFRAGYAGRSDEERHCREVIAWVRTRIGYPLEQAATVIALLEAELEEELERSGDISLP